MSSIAQSIRERIALGDFYRYDEVGAWMSVEDDAKLAAIVYYLLQDHSDRLRPQIDWVDVYPFVLRYLIRCICENETSDSDYVHSGYEAAWELAACLKQWAKRSAPESLMQLVEQ
jgi:hypothetical protein